jgi:ABC-type polysaccharide/polyol phosphate transport system ATPase subunit
MTPSSLAGAATVVELRNVGKRFTKYEDAPMLITAALRLRQRTRRSTLWAIRNVDLNLVGGESLGIIGRNGSGKSTLLSMLAGVTAPSEGSVSVAGRVAPLLSVGVGFHPELTGRENVYVNGIILGMTRKEIDRSLDEIVEFAEVQEFIDTPVKFYSSGMFVRLGFAVAVQSRPDILLVDEVLAVGDLAFQLKCFERMTAIKESGSTIVVVSHNLNAVRLMCERTAVLHQGALRFLGDTTQAISVYHDLLGEGRDLDAAQRANMATVSGVARIEEVELLGESGQTTRHLAGGERATVRARVRFDSEVTAPVVGAAVLTESGVNAYSDSQRNVLPGPAAAGSEATLTMTFRVTLVTGSYALRLGMSDGDGAQVAASTALPFYVSSRPTADGVADLEAAFRMES